MRIINAEVLAVEPVRGDGYSFDRVRLFDRESEQVIEARVGEKFGLTPREGEVVDAVVSLSVYAPRTGAPRINYDLTRSLSAPKAASGPVGVPPAKTGTNG